jgi:hypothetical protein
VGDTGVHHYIKANSASSINLEVAEAQELCLKPEARPLASTQGKEFYRSIMAKYRNSATFELKKNPNLNLFY